MKMRLTPLNIVSAALIVALIYPLIGSREAAERPAGTFLLIVLMLLCVVSDVLFRTFLRDLKRIWIVELVFLIFAAVLLILIHRI